MEWRPLLDTDDRPRHFVKSARAARREQFYRRALATVHGSLAPAGTNKIYKDLCWRTFCTDALEGGKKTITNVASVLFRLTWGGRDYRQMEFERFDLLPLENWCASNYPFENPWSDHALQSIAKSVWSWHHNEYFFQIMPDKKKGSLMSSHSSFCMKLKLLCLFNPIDPTCRFSDTCFPPIWFILRQFFLRVERVNYVLPCSVWAYRMFQNL